jgi:hypothetical protein
LKICGIADRLKTIDKKQFGKSLRLSAGARMRQLHGVPTIEFPILYLEGNE